MKVEQVTLTKKWNKHKAGSAITVDADRVTWLRKHGYCGLKSKPKERTK